jgi:cytosine/adenosine deaminase-related metal-dependent hydrolase
MIETMGQADLLQRLPCTHAAPCPLHSAKDEGQLDILENAHRRAATWRGDTFEGEIAKGKVADLVLLRSNPLSDIHHVAEIDAVFQGGRHYTRADLDAMLARAAERARALH